MPVKLKGISSVDGRTVEVVEKDGEIGGDQKVVVFDFSFDTPGLANGIDVGLTVKKGDLVLQGGVVVETPFNGTTPSFDWGTFVASPNGWSQADLTDSTLDPLSGIYFLSGYLDRPLVIDKPGPVKVVVSQNGAKDGPPINSTVGKAKFYIVVFSL